MNKLEDDKK
jgi:hypothetical protein